MHKSNHETRPKAVVVDGYRWVYEKADLEQGAYSLSDPDLKKVAVIFPADRSRPIDAPGDNAWLHIRPYGSEEWRDAGRYSFQEACIQGNRHADRYRTAEALRVLEKSISPDALAYVRFLRNTMKRSKGPDRGQDGGRDRDRSRE